MECIQKRIFKPMWPRGLLTGCIKDFESVDALSEGTKGEFTRPDLGKDLGGQGQRKSPGETHCYLIKAQVDIDV